MDVFRNIVNDTPCYGRITAKPSKYKYNLQLMIHFYTNYPRPGTFTSPWHSSLQLLYLWDKKVCLSITNAVKCPSLTKNGKLFFLCESPTLDASLPSWWCRINGFHFQLSFWRLKTNLQKKSRQNPNIYSCLFKKVCFHIWGSLESWSLHRPFTKNLVKLSFDSTEIKSPLDTNLHVVDFSNPLQLLDPMEGQLVQHLHLGLHLCLANVDELYARTSSKAVMAKSLAVLTMAFLASTLVMTPGGREGGIR